MLYIENGTAPRCIAAASTRWNSGRLVSRKATVSPRPTPRPARPPAYSRTRAEYSPQVMETASPRVRSATSSARSAAVI